MSADIADPTIRTIFDRYEDREPSDLGTIVGDWQYIAKAYRALHAELNAARIYEKRATNLRNLLIMARKNLLIAWKGSTDMSENAFLSLLSEAIEAK